MNLPIFLLDVLDRAVHDAPEDRRHLSISQIAPLDLGDLVRRRLHFILALFGHRLGLTDLGVTVGRGYVTRMLGRHGKASPSEPI
jgi:hypothetical protein